MSHYCMTQKDYKQFFNENYDIEEIDEEKQEPMYVYVEDIKNKDDGVCEFSIKWMNSECISENGVINHINTSSVFALMRCNWHDIEDDDY